MRRHLNKTYHPDWFSCGIYHLLFFPQAEILSQEGMFLISRIFKWYWADFGGSREAMLDRLLDLPFIPLPLRWGRGWVGVIEGH